jgi:hypothetical protein
MGFAPLRKKEDSRLLLHSEAPMADQPPEEIYLKHARAPDYKEIAADGTLHKMVDTHLIITFYIEDSMVTCEVLRRDDRPSGQPSYRIAAIEEERQRLDLMAVRMPTKAILGLAAAVAEQMRGQPKELEDLQEIIVNA